jgi:hypothetical protein
MKWGLLALLLAADVKELGLVMLLGDRQGGNEASAAAVGGRTALLESE